MLLTSSTAPPASSTQTDPRNWSPESGLNRNAILHFFQSRLEFSDSIFLLYLTVLLRQYCWAIPSDTLAWIATAPLAVLAWLFYLRIKGTVEERPPGLFWVIVAIPLLLVYGLRVALPDGSFDGLSYHVFHSERALHGELSIKGDFFPSFFPLLNPAPDMMTGIFRHLLGYRLGTVVNYLALLWAGIILDKLLRPYLRRGALRCLAVLLVLWAEHLLFQINGYMVDLLALPLLLEATYRAIRSGESLDQRRNLICLALLLGISVALKLTNLVFVLPIALVYLYRLIESGALSRRKNSQSDRDVSSWSSWALAVALLIAPSLPHSLYLFYQLRSPVFPFYNKLFRSPYWPARNGHDPRWGPEGFREILTWPVQTVFKPSRLSELGVYTGRISFGFIAAALCLLLVRKHQPLRLLSLIFIVGSLLWSAGTGYIRYGLYLEITGGLILLCLSAYVLEAGARLPFWMRWTLALLPCCILLGQSFFATRYIFKYDWGVRPTMVDNYQGYMSESGNLLRDRSLVQYLPEEEKSLFDGVQVWVESVLKSSAMMVMLKRDVPLIAIDREEFFWTEKARQKYQDSLRAVKGKRMYSLCLAGDFQAALHSLKEKRFVIKKATPLTLPYYSRAIRYELMLIEVLPPDMSAAELRQAMPAAGILSESGFKAQISLADKPAVLHAGRVASIRLRVRNGSDETWPAQGASDGSYRVELGNKWLDEGNRLLVHDDARGVLPSDLKPGDEVEVVINIRAPRAPGQYVLLVDAVQENIAWFEEKGSTPYRLRLSVEP